MTELNALQSRMRILLILQAIAFFCWQAAGGVSTSDQLPQSWQGPAYIISGMGVGLWVVGFILYMGNVFQAKKLMSYDVLNDEWAQHVRKKAAETAFWITMIGTVISMTLTNFGVDGALLLKILTGISVSSFLMAAVIYDREAESADD